jgi:hypothetical protein
MSLFLYGLNSILWSDVPFIGFKRGVKTPGNPVMALMILIDPDRIKAPRVVLKRSPTCCGPR